VVKIGIEVSAKIVTKLEVKIGAKILTNIAVKIVTKNCLKSSQSNVIQNH
jgi:tRNA G46 methylase TrmB